jgi:hypothetical protein
MKTKIKVNWGGYALFGAILFASCEKNDVSDVAVSTSSSDVIAVAASTNTISGTAGTTDSLYLLQPCRHDEQRDSIAQGDLPASVGSYIGSNYSRATFSKAFALKSDGSTITGYVVVIYYNDKPVGLQFDSAGNFVKVLEQRERGDKDGGGFHRGGRFEHRDGKGRDSISLGTLNAAINSYFTSNYPGDTLLKALRNRDSTILVISKNSGLFATVFNEDGTFVSRSQMLSKRGHLQSIELTALPAIAADYLMQTYPNYVFEKAFAVSQSSTMMGYVVFIDANNTKYSVEFDANGKFLNAKTIR